MNKLKRHELARQIEIAEGLITGNGKGPEQAQYDTELARRLLTEVATVLRDEKV